MGRVLGFMAEAATEAAYLLCAAFLVLSVADLLRLILGGGRE